MSIDEQFNTNLRLIRKTALLDKVGVSNTQIYNLIKKEGFPKPVPLGGRAVAWVESEVDAWILNRMNERD